MNKIVCLIGLFISVVTIPAFADTHCKGKVTYLAIGVFQGSCHHSLSY